MKKTFFLLALAIAVMTMVTSCNPNLTGVAANYAPLNNYYVDNNYNSGTHKLVINNRQDFERVFGTAAVMGRNGQPTGVDFNRQFVVAVILPETDYQTQIQTVMLNRVGNRLYYSYMVDRGHRTSYRVRPFTAVVVDRNEPNSVIFQQVTAADLEKAGIRYNGNISGNVTPGGTSSGGLRPRR